MTVSRASASHSQLIARTEGSNFLLYLEHTVGGLGIFLPYLRDYVSTFGGKAITTDMFREHMCKFFGDKHGSEVTGKLDAVDWEAWLYGEGTVSQDSLFVRSG